MRQVILAIAVSVSLVSTFGPTVAAAKTYEQRWNAASRILQREGSSCLTGLPEARRIIALGKQPDISPNAIAQMAALATLCAMRTDNDEVILEFGPLAESFTADTETDTNALQGAFIYRQLISGLATERPVLALAALHRFKPERDDAMLELISQQSWWRLKLYANQSNDPERELTYVRAQLERIAFRGMNLVEAAVLKQSFLQDRLLYSRDPDQLSALLLQVESTNVAMTILMDKRYGAAAARPEAARLRDLTGLGNAEVLVDTKRASDNPDVLAGVNTLAQSLRRMKRPAEALTIIEAAEAKVAKSKDAFKDETEALPWLHNEKAYALRDLGRIDDAFAAMRAGSQIREGSSGNVSQSINFAIMLNTAGRFTEVAQSLSTVGEGRSKYADSLILGLKYCAAVQMGTNPTNATQVFARLKELGDSGYTSTVSTALCANDINLAAQTFLALLEDPASRPNALMAAQAYRQETSTRSQFEIMIRNRALLLIEKPEIKVKLEQYGMPVTIPYHLREFEY